MRLSTMLTTLKDKLENLIEEKTWYTQSEWAQVALDKMIRLAIYLIEHVDGKIEKAKNKLKLDYEYKLLDEKAKEELRELLENIARYFDLQREERERKAEEIHILTLDKAHKKALKAAEISLANVQKITNGWNTVLTAFSQCRQKTQDTFTQLKGVPRHLLFMYSPFKQNYHYLRPKPTLEYNVETRHKSKAIH